MEVSMELRADVREEVCRRGFSKNTAAAYAGWFRGFVVFHNRRHPSVLGTDDGRAYL